ncbi:MAG: glycosyltransferase [Sphingomonas bacterium]|nr:glycosyltransferase [Sphingomonas bacterium]
MPLRIAIALHDFSLGGTERIAIRLANQWAADGADVTVLAGGEEGVLRHLLDKSVRLWVATPPIARGWGSMARLGRAVRQRMAEEPADILFVPGNYHWPVAAAFRGVAKALRPLVVAQVSNVLRKPQRGRFRQYLFEARTRSRLRGADAIVTMSEIDRLLANQILRRADCVTIPLPALDASPVPGSPIDAGSRLIVSAGRLVTQKAFEVLIDAFAIVSRHNNKVRLILVGEGPQRGLLERRIKVLGLSERVQMPGYVDDIRPFLDRARLFVLSSRFEGYGAVIVEALSAGRPVVSTASTPAAVELLSNPDAGRVVPIEDPEGLAQAIIAELEGPIPDHVALARLVKPYHIDIIAGRYEDLFCRLHRVNSDQARI